MIVFCDYMGIYCFVRCVEGMKYCGNGLVVFDGDLSNLV